MVIIQAAIALIAAIMTLVQAGLLYFGEEGICFNAGCEVVDSLTKVPPLFFNLAGAGFFLAVFWCFYRGRREDAFYSRQLGKILLLAGVAAEAVLVFFQHKIAGVFCSYCLIVLAFVILLNVLSGIPQILRGVAIFIAILVGMSALQFNKPQGAANLDTGVAVSYRSEEKGEVRYFIYSKHCPHCEELIEEMSKQLPSCSINFNPIEKMDYIFPIAQVEARQQFSPEVNLQYLSNLGIGSIPTLVVQDLGRLRVFNGTSRIRDYLRENCYPATERGEEEKPQKEQSEISGEVVEGQSVAGNNWTAPTAGECVTTSDCK